MTEHDDIIHDQGFRDGLKFVAQHLRLAADRVKEKQVHFARKLTDLADELERLISQ